VSPSEVTITFAVPSGNGLPLLSFVWQTTLLASNMPAQISPAELTVTTLLFDELKVEVGVGEITMLFESSTWIELNCTTCPCCNEKLVGLTLIVVGGAGGVDL
jgi:hypothetical protein